MSYVGKPPASAVLSSADIAQGAVTLNDINFTDQPTNMDITGVIDKHTMRLADGVTITGDVTISDDLVLSKISDDGNAITMTNDGSTRTITGSGSIEASTLSQTPNQSLTGMTGTIGSAVTGGAGLSGMTSLGTVTTGTLGSGVAFPSGKFIPLKDITHSDGSTGSGYDVDMLSLSLDLTLYEGYTLYAWCHTAISENANTGNTSIIRAKLNNGSSTTYFASQRQGIAVYSTVAWSGDSTASISCQGYFVVTNDYATTCTLYMNGGINSGAFTWGDQGSYTYFDGETPKAGATLGYMLFHP